jgi:sua5/yciO/yrdC/ywlC family protein
MEKLLETLKSGGIILYPTDTIWGIGCDATDDEAVMKIFKLKNRDQNKPLIILVESEKRLQDLVEVPAVAWDIIDLSEKPITIVYDAPKGISKNLMADDGSIGIRLVKDEFCKRLISKLNKPIVSTSANFSGEKSPKSFADISQKLINEVDAVAEDQINRVSKWEASSIIRVWNDGRIKVIRE